MHETIPTQRRPLRILGIPQDPPCRMNHFSISTAQTRLTRAPDTAAVRRDCAARSEDRIERRNIARRHLQRYGKHYRSQEKAIRSGAELEIRGTLGPTREHVAHLRQRQDGEDHRLPMGVSLAVGPGLGDERHATHEKAHPNNVLPHHLREDAFARGSVAKSSASSTAFLEHWAIARQGR